MIMCLSTKGYCFQEQCANVLPIVFLLFCNLKILKQGIEMQIFPKRVVEILKKKGEPPRQVTFNLGRSHYSSRTQINAGGPIRGHYSSHLLVEVRPAVLGQIWPQGDQDMLLIDLNVGEGLLTSTL